MKIEMVHFSNYTDDKVITEGIYSIVMGGVKYVNLDFKGNQSDCAVYTREDFLQATMS
jgi:hypothetical protein